MSNKKCMSNPFKDARIRKSRNQRQQNAEKYNCAIIWYDTHPDIKEIDEFPEHKQRFPQIANEVKPHFLELAEDRFPFITILKENEPAVEELVLKDSLEEDRWQKVAASQNEGEVKWFPVWYSVNHQFVNEEDLPSLRNTVEERLQELVDELELIRGYPKYDSYELLDGVKTEFDS